MRWHACRFNAQGPLWSISKGKTERYIVVQKSKEEERSMVSIFSLIHYLVSSHLLSHKLHFSEELNQQQKQKYPSCSFRIKYFNLMVNMTTVTESDTSTSHLKDENGRNDYDASSSSDSSNDPEFDESLISETFGPSSSGDNNGSSTSGGIRATVGEMGARATKNVNRTKCLVYLVLSLAATGFGVAVFTLLQKEETKDFETQVRKKVEGITLINVMVSL